MDLRFGLVVGPVSETVFGAVPGLVPGTGVWI